MKKLLSALLCALLIGSCAIAESSAFPTPAPEISAEPDATPDAASESQLSAGGSMDFTINGKTLKMDFDPDPEYSICRDGYVQASFYAKDTDGLLYELYVTFPQSVQSGDTVTPDECRKNGDIGSGLMLFVSDDADMDVCSAATQYLTGPYPEGSSYAISFTSVIADGSLYTFKGAMNGSLVEVDDRFYATSTVNECSANFSFTMDLGAAKVPEKDRTAPDAGDVPTPAIPELPDSTPESEATPAPEKKRPPTPPAHLTTPSDAQKI